MQYAGSRTYDKALSRTTGSCSADHTGRSPPTTRGLRWVLSVLARGQRDPLLIAGLVARHLQQERFALSLQPCSSVKLAPWAHRDQDGSRRTGLRVWLLERENMPRQRGRGGTHLLAVGR